MKLSNLTAKLTCMKRNAVRILSVAALAGATLAVAAPAAQAQQFGYRTGPYRPAPRFDAPVYRDRFFADGRYWQDRRAHEEFLRHLQWERFHHEHDRYGWR